MPDEADQERPTSEAEEYRRLAELAMGAAMSTLNPKAALAFYIASQNYLAKAKALDPSIPDPPSEPPGSSS